MDLQKITVGACKIVKEVGEFIRQERGEVGAGQIETKSLNSLVSYVDKKAEEMLVSALGKLTPDAAFLTEEETVKTEEKLFRWIIDPLDGTTNFLHQIPVFSISIALQRKDKTIIGIVYEINNDECFSGWLNGGVFLNGRKVSVTREESLSDVLVATGFPYFDFARTTKYLEVLEYFMRHSRGVRRLGSAAVDLAYVACGRFGGFYEYSLNAWDVAAGAFLVEEAGGFVSDFSGGEKFLFGKEIVAAGPDIFQEMLPVIKRKMG